MTERIETDVIIIGAGPVGLFAVFELGLLDIKAHVVDILDRSPAGNAPSSIPRSRSTTFPASRSSPARGWSTSCIEQIKPFGPDFHLGEMVEGLETLGTPTAALPGRDRRRQRSSMPRSW